MSIFKTPQQLWEEKNGCDHCYCIDVTVVWGAKPVDIARTGTIS